MSKIYVTVEARFHPEEGIEPLCLIWEDGRRYEIDRILDVRRAASLKAGGVGIRYTVMILGQPRFLFMEEDRWFVEGKDSQ